MNRLKHWLKEAVAAVLLVGLVVPVMLLAVLAMAVAAAVMVIVGGLMVVYLPLAAMTGNLKVAVKEEGKPDRMLTWDQIKEEQGW
jgi:hypothetical protein